MADTYQKLKVHNTTPGIFICPGVQMRIGQRMRDVVWKPNAVVALAKFGITREYLDQSTTFQSALRMGLKLVPDGFNADPTEKADKPAPKSETQPSTIQAKDDPDTVAVEDLDPSKTGEDQTVPRAPEKLDDPDAVVATGDNVDAATVDGDTDLIDRLSEGLPPV